MTEFPDDKMRYASLPIRGRDNIHLQQLLPNQAEELFAVTDANRDRLDKWLPWVERTKDASDSKDFIRDMLSKRQTGEEYGYGIIRDGEIVGHTSLMHLADGQDAEIGYWIAESAKGEGIATDAAATLTDFAFAELQLPKIIIKADPDNHLSNRIAERLGYKLTGQVTGKDDGSVSNVWAMTHADRLAMEIG